ncbi:cell division protein FtsQ/DivIB [Salinimicrobium sp. GXAS 041]|uniref:cell division protein FtsQ/DivIB n=1 Tax=Salinimicrobium sp. GXAS 041 TaxID=3400806 RepID=UPI003C75B51D
MKINWNYIKGFLLIAAVFFLFAFAEKRNNSRKLAEVNLQFTNSENLYVTEEAVNKLLIQNHVVPKSIDKDTLDLSRVEAVLDAHEMIEKAEVYMSVDGRMGADITQRKPIGRVLAARQYYVDRQGEKMPLSEFYSARVPLVTGIREEHVKEVFPLLDFIRKDPFLKIHVTGINRLYNGMYELEVREQDFSVHFGAIENIERKATNFKAFYQKAMKDKKLNAYKKVDLQFRDQVVSTKK